MNTEGTPVMTDVVFCHPMGWGLSIQFDFTEKTL